MNREDILSKLENLRSAYNSGKIPALHDHEQNPGLDRSSRENYLYFIMTCSLNYQRSSPKTWMSALQTWNDEETQFLFFPEKVVRTDVEKVRNALLKHKLGLQPTKHTEIWLKISETFNTHFDSDPRNLFKQGNFDSIDVLHILQKDMKKHFPYLSGPKLSNYTLFILLHYSDLKLKNTRAISIIPDTHIMQATEKLGMVRNGEKLTPELVAGLWHDLLKESDLSPIDYHSMLWNWSRNSFQPEV